MCERQGRQSHSCKPKILPGLNCHMVTESLQLGLNCQSYKQNGCAVGL